MDVSDSGQSQKGVVTVTFIVTHYLLRSWHRDIYIVISVSMDHGWSNTKEKLVEYTYKSSSSAV